MYAMTDEYMKWRASRGPAGWEDTSFASEPLEDNATTRSIRIIDVFRDSDSLFTKPNDKPVTAALFQRGLVPCAPERPSLAITVRTMEIFRLQRLRCPRLSIQSFVRFLCDMHLQPIETYLYQQFSICFDVYIAVCRSVRQRVEKAMGFTGDHWRIQHACPPCMYQLQGEEELRFSMLVTYDGNDSAKRVLRRRRNEDGSVGSVSERVDQRKGGEDYFLSREEVDEWSKENMQDLMEAVCLLLLIERNSPLIQVTTEYKKNPCEDRWQNMIHDMSSKAWGIFDETGMFVSLCRHGFVLIAADMVQSGEL